MGCTKYTNLSDDKRIVVYKFFNEEKSDIEKFRINQADHESQKNKLKSEITSKDGTIQLLQNDIRDEQKSLSIRLSTITGRLNYGEIALERTLELSGLKENIDYFLQQPIEDNQELIPDATIKLPKNRNIYIDAKYPDAAYTKLTNSHKANASTTYVTSFKTLINNTFYTFFEEYSTIINGHNHRD